MKKLTILLAIVAVLSGCVTFGNKTAISEDNVYYTQYSFFYKAGLHSSANYREGTLIPINTRVKLISEGGYDIMGDDTFQIITVDGRHKITVSNDKSNSGLTIKEYRDRLIGREKADLSKYNDEVQDYIRNGEAAIGMNKEMVLKAMGYPSADLTPSIKDENWVYRLNLLQKSYLTFRKDDILKDVFHK